MTNERIRQLRAKYSYDRSIEWLEGYDQYWANQSVKLVCPYPVCSAKGKEWRLGFDSAGSLDTT